MTSMPERVAILHSFVGLAAVLVGVASYLGTPVEAGSAEALIHEIEVFVGVFVGAVTFTGSIIAFGKLRGIIGSRPLLLPGRHLLNAVASLGCVGLAIPFLSAAPGADLRSLVELAAIAGLLGIHLVMAIGGADMPVVVSMLNSYSGCGALTQVTSIPDEEVVCGCGNGFIDVGEACNGSDLGGASCTSLGLPRAARSRAGRTAPSRPRPACSATRVCGSRTRARCVTTSTWVAPPAPTTASRWATSSATAA